MDYRDNLNPNFRHPASIIINALDKGISVEDFVMLEDGNIGLKYGDGGVYCDISLNDFIKFCSKLSQDEIFLIAAQVAMLNKMEK